MPLTAQGRFSRGRADSLDAPEIQRNAARRSFIAFAGIGIAAYAVAMIVTMPASVVLKNYAWRAGVAGTVWNGEVGVIGGTKFDWHWASLRSITSLGYAADWKATGPDTDMGGRILARPGRAVADKVSGAASGTLLQALLPALPFTCDFAMQVELPRMVLGGRDQMIDGTIKTDAGTCTPKAGGAGPSTIPALILTAEHVGATTRLRLAPLTQRRRALMDATLAENGQMEIQMTAEGAAMLPFTGLPAGLKVQTEL